MPSEKKTLLSVLKDYTKNNDQTTLSIMEDYGKKDKTNHIWAEMHKKHLTEKLDAVESLELHEKRKGQQEGQTVLHILICREDIECLKKILETVTEVDDCRKLLGACASGPMFNKTVMMGQLPFTTAALTFNKEILNTLFYFGKQIGMVTPRGTSEDLDEKKLDPDERKKDKQTKTDTSEDPDERAENEIAQTDTSEDPDGNEKDEKAKRDTIEDTDGKEKDEKAKRDTIEDPDEKEKDEKAKRDTAEDPDGKEKDEKAKRDTTEDPDGNEKDENAKRDTAEDPDGNEKDEKAKRDTIEDTDGKEKDEKAKRDTIEDPDEKEKDEKAKRDTAEDPDGKEKDEKAKRDTTEDPDGNEKDENAKRDTAEDPDGKEKDEKTNRDTIEDPDGNLNKDKANVKADEPLNLLVVRNELGDTVLHSLIRYAHVYPLVTDKVKDMMQHLNELFLREYEGISPRTFWLIENNDGRTPLKLAAELTQPEIFDFIIHLEGVYSELRISDGLYDYFNYDITELDVAACVGRSFSQKSRVGGSVLEIVCACPPEEGAFKLLQNSVVKQTIYKKWEKYKKWVWISGISYFMFLVWMTVYTIFKCQVVLLKNQTSVFDGRNIDGQMIVGEAQERFVLASTIFFFLISLVLLILEFLRIRRGHRYHIDLAHHNGVYRIQLVLLAIGLCGDAVWYWAAPDSYNNYFIILALVMGWWFMTFFLRPFRKFSFFTIMLQEVLSGDLIRFSSVIFFVYMSFSTAMYAVFLPKPPKEFDGYDKTMLTMFDMMLGQTNVEVLHEASEPWLAVLLFTLFLVLTYILMLNALIALISNTFITAFKAREELKEMQRLAVVLFIESSLPLQRFVHIVGGKEEWPQQSGNGHEKRYTIQIQSSGSSDFVGKSYAKDRTPEEKHGKAPAKTGKKTREKTAEEIQKEKLLNSLRLHWAVCTPALESQEKSAEPQKYKTRRRPALPTFGEKVHPLTDVPGPSHVPD